MKKPTIAQCEAEIVALRQMNSSYKTKITELQQQLETTADRLSKSRLMYDDMCVKYEELQQRLAEAERDAKRIDWWEANTTLHNSVEALYVVDGYEIHIINDRERATRTTKANSIRAAIDAAIAQEKV